MAGSASPLIVALRGPVLTILLLSGVVLAVVSVREGGPQAGLEKILTNPHASNSLQRELHSIARRDTVIDGLLKAVLVKAPTAARVRLAVIHNGEVGLSGIGLLRFDVTHGTVRKGFSVGTFTSNGPLADWNPYLNKLLAGQCTVVGLEEMSAGERVRMVELGVQARMACPVMDIQGRLLGAVFIHWPADALVPEGADLNALEDFTRSVGSQIAAATTASGEGD